MIKEKELEKFTKYRIGYFERTTGDLIGYSDTFDDIEEVKKEALKPISNNYCAKVVIEEVIRWELMIK